MTNIYEAIFTRKSVNKFEKVPLNKKTIDEIEEFIAEVPPLLPEAQITHEIVTADAVKGFALPNAPQFMLLYGKDQPLREACAAFQHEHVVLYLHSQGFAAHWLSSVSPKEKDPNFIIGFAFGTPAEPATRELTEFDRKPVSEIATGADLRLDATRLAPSGMNGQPWYFIVEDDHIFVYCKQKLDGFKGMFYNQTKVDIGLALAHLKIASNYEGGSFEFTTEVNNWPEAPSGYSYIGAVR